jgi:hypothetical protein
MALGSVPISGPRSMALQQGDHNEQYAELFRRLAQRLQNVFGTNTVTARAEPRLSSIADGQSFVMVPSHANTSAVTLNIDRVGAFPVLRSHGEPLQGGDLVPGRPFLLLYSNSKFYCLNLDIAQRRRGQWVTISSENYVAQSAITFADLGEYDQLRLLIDGQLSANDLMLYYLGFDGSFLEVDEYASIIESLDFTGSGANEDRTGDTQQDHLRPTITLYEATTLGLIVETMITRWKSQARNALVVNVACYDSSGTFSRYDWSMGTADLNAEFDQFKLSSNGGATFTGNILLQGRVL